MERLLPTELLTLAKKARADFFDEEIAQKLAQQSQFEKQMVTKLLQVRRERVVVEDNFWMARDVMKELLETVKAASAPEEASPLANNAEKLIFKERTLSFYKWMLAEQRKEAAEENLRICEEVVSVLVDLALHSAEVMDEWNTMIFANYPLLDMTDQEELVERLEKLEKLKNLSVFGEDEDSMWASSNLCKQLAKEAALDRVAVREYIDLKGRWDPSRCEKDLDVPSESGIRVLGHALPEAAKLPPRTVAAALLGVRDPRSRRVLRRLLEAQRVLLVEPEAAVADCVERFQQENVPEDTEDEITEAPAKSIEEEKEPTPPKPDRSSKKPSKKCE
ncbi:Sperm flagellar protein 2 [Gryllus bimaculatus]|nr:Sperm flagellar protein 2 [Gryllus bimaculatus]